LRTFSRTSQFKKDVQRLERRGKSLGKLKAVIELLTAGHHLPALYLDHPLRGNYAGSRDCHIEPDWILIYTLEQKRRSEEARSPPLHQHFSSNNLRFPERWLFTILPYMRQDTALEPISMFGGPVRQFLASPVIESQ
jgi:mRNA interferase YafQ